MIGTGMAVPGGVQQRRTGGGTPATQPFTATNNLIGTQINPVNSAFTQGLQNQTQGAANQYAGFGFKPFQGVSPLNLSSQTGMLNGANTQMQGLGFNFGGANSQYGNAQAQLGAGRERATGELTGLQGLGIEAFSGGGANMADFSKAENKLGGVEGMMGPSFGYEGDTKAARGLTSAALERAMNGPERNALAAESLALLEERSRRGYDDAMRTTADQQSAMGRRGSGQTAKALNDVTNRREQELAWARRDLANEASSRTLEDRTGRANLAMGITAGLGNEDRGAQSLRNDQARILIDSAGMLGDNAKFNASQGEAASQRAAQGSQFGANFQRGLSGDLYGMSQDASRLSMDVGDRFGQQERDRIGLGQDQANFTRGIGNDLARFSGMENDSARVERNDSRRDEYNQGDFARSRFNDFNSAFQGQQNQDRSSRNELRDERGFQYGLSQDAIDNEYRRMDFEEGLRNNRFNRGLATANTGFGAPSPANAYGMAGGQARGMSEGSFGDMASIIAMMGARGGRRSGGGAGGAPAASGVAK